MAALFVSDVHLSAQRPRIVSAFIDFLNCQARDAEVLYILGDCFDRWLGDDDDTPPHGEVLAALADLTRAGVPVNVLHGNHDFLLGAGFEGRTGCRLLEDPSVVEVYGTPTLLMHGDTLCTDDIEYQKFRAYSRDPAIQATFLKMPLAERAAEADRLRAKSKTHTRLKAEEIMDVSAGAVLEVMRNHGTLHLIHGHTHRPAVHVIEVDGDKAQRIVLADWYEQDSVLVWDSSGFRMNRVVDLNAA